MLLVGGSQGISIENSLSHGICLIPSFREGECGFSGGWHLSEATSSLTGGWRMKTREVRCHCNGWWSTRRCFPCGWRVEIRKKKPERISVQNPASDGDKLSSTGAEFCQSLVFSIMWIQVFCMHLKYQDVFHSIFAGRFFTTCFFWATWCRSNEGQNHLSNKKYPTKIREKSSFSTNFFLSVFHRKKNAEFFFGS